MKDLAVVMELLFRVIDEINTLREDGKKMTKSADTPLFGQGSDLDSFGLVEFIVATEQLVEEDFETTITLADERAMSQQQSPFKTVGALAEYVTLLLSEQSDG